MNFKLRILPLLLAFTLVMPGLARAQREPVLIGAVEPLTGQAAASGQMIMRGIELAVEEINRNGGILGGRPIKVTAEDGKCIPSESVNAAKKLIYQDKVSALIGALCSSATVAVQNLTGSSKTVHVSAAPSSPILTDPAHRHKYYFRTTYNSADFSKGFAEFIKEKIGPKSMAYLAVNDDYGRAEVDGLIAKLAEGSGPATAFKGFFEYRDTDFTSVLARIRSENPDGIYLVARTPQNVVILKQMRSIGFRPKFLAGDISFGERKTAEDSGDAIEGMYFPTLYFPNDTNQGALDFQRAYRAKYNVVPLDVTAALGWTALQVVARGIDKAGTSTDPDKIAAAIQAIEWDGPFGTVKFDSNGQNMVHVRIGQVVKGEAVEKR